MALRWISTRWTLGVCVYVHFVEIMPTMCIMLVMLELTPSKTYTLNFHILYSGRGGVGRKLCPNIYIYIHIMLVMRQLAHIAHIDTQQQGHASACQLCTTHACWVYPLQIWIITGGGGITLRRLAVHSITLAAKAWRLLAFSPCKMLSLFLAFFLPPLSLSFSLCFLTKHAPY